jgi:hypothetical protein
MEYIFTNDWLSSKVDIWNRVIKPLGSINNILEVGSYEGRSAIWFIENILSENTSISCVDDWSWADDESLFDKNIEIVKNKFPTIDVIKLSGDSQIKLAELLLNKKTYDLIYIDGKCDASKRLSDACGAWTLLNLNGVMVFDDYLYISEEANLKLAIDYFCTIFQNKYKYLYVGKQVIIQKTKE